MGNNCRSRSDRNDYAIAQRVIDRQRKRAVAYNRATQLKMLQRPQRSQMSQAINVVRDHGVIPYSGGVDSEGDVIKPLHTGFGGRHIAIVVAAAIHDTRL